MSDEELADVLREFATKPMQGGFLKWLQQPAREDDYGYYCQPMPEVILKLKEAKNEMEAKEE